MNVNTQRIASKTVWTLQPKKNHHDFLILLSKIAWNKLNS